LNPYEDPSASYRIAGFKRGVEAFRANPLIGFGAYYGEGSGAERYRAIGHNTFITAAYEYGLLFLLPFLWLLFRVGKEYIRLVRRVTRPLEKGIAIGMLASFLAAFITGFITPVFMESGQDAIIWVFIGLMTVWNYWLDRDPDAELIS
jgi:O-antigen ligase